MTRQLIAFGLFSAGDALSTAYALTLPGFSEANALAASFGGGMYAFKAVATLSVIVVVWRLRHRCAGFVSRWALRGGITVTGLVVASNLAQLAVAL